MERQRSFSFKSAGFFVFTLTIFTSLFFLAFFSIWIIKSTPLVHQETHIQVKSTILGPGLSNSSSDFSVGSRKDSILGNTHFNKPEITSGFSIIEGIEGKDGENESPEGDFSTNFSAGSRKDSILGNTQFDKPENASGFSIIEGNEGKESVNESPEGNFSTNFSVGSGKGSILGNTQFDKPVNASGFSIIEGIEGKESENESPEGDFSRNFSVGSGKDSILGNTQFDKPENASGFPNLEIEVKDSENESPEDSAPGFSSEEVEVRANSSEKFYVLNLRSEGNAEKKNESVETSIDSHGERIEEKEAKNCEISKGRWVYDASYPLYTNNSCPFIDEGFNCASNGRLDQDYMKWRWKPQGCDIPRFNASRMLDLIRGKRLVFVGDSINRNQWESMLCMLMSAIKDPKKVYEARGRRITKEKGNYCFRFVDYKCTVEYYVSHFLVHEGKARIGQKRKQILRIDAIDHGSSRWRGADILIFNTAHWWSHYKTKAGINYYQEGNQVHPRLDVSTAFRRAMTTWASWVDKHINPRRTQVFFRNSSPSHFRGGQWNSGGHCTEASRPLNDTSNMIYPEKNKIVEDVIAQMKTPVTLLNVTGLSGYRIDGHPSVYGKKPVNLRSSNVQDCSHWCLPGVPDTWNELLYFHLQRKQENRLQFR